MARKTAAGSAGEDTENQGERTRMSRRAAVGVFGGAGLGALASVFMTGIRGLGGSAKAIAQQGPERLAGALPARAATRQRGVTAAAQAESAYQENPAWASWTQPSLNTADGWSEPSAWMPVIEDSHDVPYLHDRFSRLQLLLPGQDLVPALRQPGLEHAGHRRRRRRRPALAAADLRHRQGPAVHRHRRAHRRKLRVRRLHRARHHLPGGLGVPRLLARGSHPDPGHPQAGDRATHSTHPSGAPMRMEQFLIDVAKALGLPGFGAGALPGGGDLHVREDLYLKMLANIAYDPQFLTWQGPKLAPGGPVPDGSPADLAAIAGLRRAHGTALRDAEWRKAAYVLARGGRFEDYACAYEPNLDVLARVAAAATDQLPGTGVQDWARAPHQRAPEDLAAAYGRLLTQIRAAVGHRTFPAWVASRYGSGGTQCQIYSPTVAGARNSLTGESFAGTARYEPPHDYAGRLLTDLDQAAEFPLVLVTHKSAVTSRGLGSVCPWLAEMSPEGFLDMNPRDAARLGLAAGDVVSIRSGTYPKGITGRLRLLPGIRPGVVAFPHGYLHWRYASGTWEIDGKKTTGDASHNAPVRLNGVMRLDPSLAGPGGWTIGLLDPVGGGQAYFETRVAVEKA